MCMYVCTFFLCIFLFTVVRAGVFQVCIFLLTRVVTVVITIVILRETALEPPHMQFVC